MNTRLVDLLCLRLLVLRNESRFADALHSRLLELFERSGVCLWRNKQMYALLTTGCLRVFVNTHYIFSDTRYKISLNSPVK
jgi:hypothetical protein